MGLIIGIDQTLLRHMGVDLRGRQAPMSEQVLDAPEVGAAIEEVGGEAVPEGVGARARVEAESDQVILEESTDASRRESTTAMIQEEGGLAGL
jgi:hypothetical protein